MSKISKNIKQLRQERGMTQDDLAEKLFVTRQAISSWENDRTQPDVHMLGKLREIFGVSIEELLYGKKRNTALELHKPDYTATLITVFSVLGAILAGAGVIMIFGFSWERLPDFLRGSLCFLPMLAGQAAGVFVLTKKQDKKAWYEGGSVLWMAGVIASGFMCCSFFGFRVAEWVPYLVMTLMVLSVMLVMKSVAALPVFYGFGTWFCLMLAEENGSNLTDYWRLYQFFAAALLMGVLAVGVYFTVMLKKTEPKSFSSDFALWITAIAFPVITTFFVVLNNLDYNIPVYWVSAILLAYSVFAQRKKDAASPFSILGFIGTAVLSGYYGIAFDIADTATVEDEGVIAVVAGFALVAGAVVSIKGKFRTKTQLAAAVIFLVMQTVYVFSTDAMLTFFSLAFFAIMIGEGALSKKLLPMNTGFVGFLFLIMCWVIQADLDTLETGLVLLCCGGAILGVNLVIAKSKKRVPESTEEVAQ